MELFNFQNEVLKQSENLTRVAYYYDMGLGKTFIGAEKLNRLNAEKNLVICQKSKISDWIKHFETYYSVYKVFDLTEKKQFIDFFKCAEKKIGIINYELSFRRIELSFLENFTLLLDESSMIQNENSQRTKFVMNKLKPANIILLSGTPTGGKYERLWTQLYLLGYKINKTTYWNEYVDFYVNNNFGFPLKIINGYKNVDRLKRKMSEYGCFFKKTDEVFDLPEQNFITINVETSKQYKDFQKKSIVTVDDVELVGDTTLTQLLYERQLCSIYSKDKLNVLYDLLSSSDDRFVIFYNFNDEYKAIEQVCFELDKQVSIVNGSDKDLSNYEEENNSVTLIQYQSGAMGLNLQKANKIIYFSPCLSSELFEQSKKRIHRIGQSKPCFYYQLVCENSVEEKIYKVLAMRKDFTEKLFLQE